MIAPPNDREAILAWARRWSADRKPAVMFSLTYAAEMERFSPLGVRPVARALSQEERHAEIEDVVDAFIRQAEGWSATKQRPQTFAIGAHRTEDPAVAPVDQIPLVVRPEGDFQGRAEVDPRDTLGTLQRQNSDLVRAFGSNMQADMDRLVQENESQRRHIQQLQKTHLEYVLRQQDLLDRKALRDIEVEERRLKLTVIEQGAGMAMAWIGQQIEQGARRPEKRTEPVPPAAVIQLVSSLTAEQRALLRPVWPAIEAGMSEEGRAEFRNLAVAARAGARLNGAPATPEAPPPEHAGSA